MKIQIQPLTYRAGTGIALELTNFSGNPPVTVNWQIVTDIGHPLETGTEILSSDEWINWPAGEDNDYVERIVAARIGIAVI